MSGLLLFFIYSEHYGKDASQKMLVLIAVLPDAVYLCIKNFDFTFCSIASNFRRSIISIENIDGLPNL